LTIIYTVYTHKDDSNTKEKDTVLIQQIGFNFSVRTPISFDKSHNLAIVLTAFDTATSDTVIDPQNPHAS